jgi:putative ATPase
MKEMGYAKDYKHAHKEVAAVTDMQCLPDSLVEEKFYHPTDRGFEQKLRERLDWLEKRRGKTPTSAD